MSNFTNPFEHHHDQETPPPPPPGSELPAAELDPAQQSLADALRVSFGILKFVLLVLIVLYLVSGVTWGIDPQQRAVRLRFGQIVGQTPDEALMLPGRIYFAFPYPIDQVIYIPVSDQSLSLKKEFWYYIAPGTENLSEEDRISGAGALRPDQDGSLLTGDGNIVHVQWTIQYRIQQPLDFIRHVAPPGSEPRRLLEAARDWVAAAAEEAIVAQLAQTTAEQATRGEIDRQAIRSRIQNLLDKLQTGIAVTEVVADSPTFPLAVKRDFRAVTEALSEKAQKIEAARQEATRLLTEAAGAAHDVLRRLINHYEQARAAGDLERAQQLDARLAHILETQQAPAWAALPDPRADQLWEKYLAFQAAQSDPNAVLAAKAALDQALDQAGLSGPQRAILPVGGEVARIINEARAYRSSIVAEIQAEALTFNPRAIDPATRAEGLLDQYRRSPQVFLNRQWQDMVEAILSGDIEVFYLPPGQTYLELSRDRDLEKRRQMEKFKAEQEQRRQQSSR